MTAPTADEVRRLVAAAQGLVGRATALLVAGEGLRRLGRQQLDRLKADEVDRRLRTMPLSTLKEAVGRGARLGALEKAGFRTVADVLHAYGLQTVPGVGDATARQVMHAARAAAAAVHRDVRFRFDPDRRDPEQTELLATLAALRAADGMPPALRRDLAVLVQRTEPLATTAARAGSRVSMFFALPSTKTAVRTAVGTLAETLASPSTHAASTEVDRFERATNPTCPDTACTVRTGTSPVGSGCATAVSPSRRSTRGSVSPQARQQIVEELTAKPAHAVLLSQIEAGGVGINMQVASVVVLAEPQWKPSVEEQAIARAHRMGQIRPVQVHRLLAKDSVDERIREIQAGKRLLFDAFARRRHLLHQTPRAARRARAVRAASSSCASSRSPGSVRSSGSVT